VLAFGVLSVSSAGAATWRAGMTINNNSKYELTLVQTYVEQVENFNPAIPHTLAPGKTAAWENCGPGGLGPASRTCWCMRSTAAPRRP
jgi:hypothetical protein